MRRPLLVLALVAALALPAPALQAAADQEASGEPGPSGAGVRVTPHQLPRGGGGPAPVQGVPRLYPVDAATFGLMKAAANAAAAARLPGGAPRTGPAPQFPTLGIGDAGGWNPPDGALAVGPAVPSGPILVAVNEAFALYGRGGGPPVVGPVSFQSFFGTGDSVFDPRALYDAGHGRFVLLAVTVNGRSRTAAYTLAVSQNERPQDPTTVWCTYKLNAVTGTGGTRGQRAWADFPGLGMDGDNLYITSNQFAFGSNFFQQVRLLVVPKASVYPDAATGACPVASSRDFQNLKNPDGGTAFTVQPANQPDALAGQISAVYLVNAVWSSGSRLALRGVGTTAAVCGAAPPPCLRPPSWVEVAPYDLPADAPQLGGSPIDTGDTRLLGAVDRFGQLYTGHSTRAVSAALSTSPNAYANAQWYVITPGAPTAASHAVTDPSIAYFFPGVMPGSAFVGVEVSGAGPNQPASAFVLRGGGAPSAFATGVAGYTLNGRWGDYPGMAHDPADTSGVWVLGEYAAATNGWGTAVTTVP